MLFRISCQPDTIITWDQDHSHSRCKPAAASSFSRWLIYIVNNPEHYSQHARELFRSDQSRPCKTHKMHLIKREKNTRTIILSEFVRNCSKHSFWYLNHLCGCFSVFIVFVRKIFMKIFILFRNLKLNRKVYVTSFEIQIYFIKWK